MSTEPSLPYYKSPKFKRLVARVEQLEEHIAKQTEREKALIALAVAHAVQCPYCIDAYTQECLSKGADLDQMTEAVHVASAIMGGASLVHGVQMKNVNEKLTM